jgi:hypothetical protein
MAIKKHNIKKKIKEIEKDFKWFTKIFWTFAMIVD